MNNGNFEMLRKLVDDAFGEMGYHKCFTIDQICDHITKNKNDIDVTELKKHIDSNAEYKTKNSNGIIKYTKAKAPSIVLVGNSPNLIEKYNAGAEWQKLLKSLEEICVPYLGSTHRLSSFPQRMQAICNLYKLRSMMDSSENDPVANVLKEWFEAVVDLRPTPIHRMLAEMDFDYYLTTNYDYAFEQLLYPDFLKKQKRTFSDGVELLSSSLDNKDPDRVNKEENKVIHIHGRADDIKNIVMLPRSYVDATKSLNEEKKPFWLEKFCKSEVHICGLNLGPEETLVWYALESRLQCMLKKRIMSSYPRAYVYLFFNETDDKKDYHDKCAMRDLLRTYAVNTILIPVRNNDYIQAWKLLIGEMMLAKNKCRLQYEQNAQNADEEDAADILNDELEKALKKTEYGGGRLASLRSNMSTAFVSHYMYPYHCWISMSIMKEALIKKSGSWLCYCKIDSERRMYCFPSTGCIASYLKRKANKKGQFMLDYRTGMLYEIVDDFSLKKIGCGLEIKSLSQFCKMKYSELIEKEEKSTSAKERKSKKNQPGIK